MPNSLQVDGGSASGWKYWNSGLMISVSPLGRLWLGVAVVLAATIFPSFCAAVELPPLKIPRVSSAPKLSDFLNGTPREAEAVVTIFKQFDPHDGEPVSQPTAAYLSYDSKNLYVGWICKDDSAKIRARAAQADRHRRPRHHQHRHVSGPQARLLVRRESLWHSIRRPPATQSSPMARRWTPSSSTTTRNGCRTGSSTQLSQSLCQN